MDRTRFDKGNEREEGKPKWGGKLMLTIQQLICKNPKYHRDCHWEDTLPTYPDNKYPMIKAFLPDRVISTNIAHRVVHNVRGDILTIKMGNDGKLFIQEK